MVLNINRDSMAGVGFSPPTRVFEAAGAGACLITDRWAGIENFFLPEKEILVAANAEEIVACLRNISGVAAKQIGGKCGNAPCATIRMLCARRNLTLLLKVPTQSA